MSASGTAIDTVLALENAVKSQMTDTVVAPTITIECYRDPAGEETWSIFAGENSTPIGTGASLVQAAAMIGRKRA